MDSRIILGLISIILLVGCAEVGTLTGGGKDTYAPKPIEGKTVPENGSTEIYPKEVSITFDEFFTLVNPNETIFLIPNDSKVSAEIKKKELVLSLNDSLKENTTYVIYLNKAVKDITEGNDSIMKHVFSTGKYIDSLQYDIQVLDAFSNKPIKDVVVGLYSSSDNSIAYNSSPRYFSSTDSKGKVKFDYLAAGEYYAYAFVDADRNLKLSKGESRGFLKSSIQLDTASQTLLPIIRLINTGVEEQISTSNEYLPTGRWCLGFNQAFSDSLKIKNLSDTEIEFLLNEKRDSIIGYFIHTSDVSKLKVAIFDGSFVDTISKNIPKLDKYSVNVTSNLVSENLLVGDSLTLTFSDIIKSVDTSKMILKQKNDTIEFSLLQSKPNELKLVAPYSKDSSYFSFDIESIEFLNGPWNDTTVIKFKQLSTKDVGTIIANIDSLITTPGILELLKDNKVVKSVKTEPGQATYTFKNLVPGNYNYRFIYDTDSNGKWTKGDFDKQIEPERVIWFNESSKVRPNWDIEAELKTP